MQAVILAAGTGNRMKPLTHVLPKPLIELHKKPILEWVLASLPKEIDEVIIVTKHLQEKIHGYIGNEFKGKKIIYTEQGEMSATYGALKSAEHLLRKNESFLVLNSDDILDRTELTSFIQHTCAFGVSFQKHNPYFAIEEDSQGFVSGFHKQTPEEKEQGSYIATGTYMLDTNFFSLDPVLLSDGGYGIPQTLVEHKDIYPIQRVELQQWVQINSFRDLEKAHEKITS